MVYMSTVPVFNVAGFMGRLNFTRTVWETLMAAPPIAGVMLATWGRPVETLAGLTRLVLGLNGPF
jgi:hypothetical protein